MPVQFAFIIHRGMGCDDESATDEEQAEKIMFFHPQSVDLNEQLSKINMVEGLIDFAEKFCVDPISTVVMQQYTWAFLECEKNVWFIIAVDSQVNTLDTSASASLPTYIHQPNTYAMESLVRNMYDMYRTTHGSIQGGLSNIDDGSGLLLIDEVKKLRKRLRKIRIRMRQEMQDLQSLIDREIASSHRTADTDKVEHMGIRANTKTVSEVQTEIDASQEEIASINVALSATLSNPQYSPTKVRHSLKCFVSWYLAIGALDVQTGLATLPSQRPLHPSYPDPVLHTISACSILSIGSNSVTATAGAAVGSGGSAVSAAVNAVSTPHNSCAGEGGCVSAAIHSGQQMGAGAGMTLGSALLRVRRAVDEATGRRSTGCMVMYDGRVAWSDLDSRTGAVLAEYVLLQEAQSVRSAASHVLRNLDTRPLPGGMAPSSGNSKRSSANLDVQLETVVGKHINQLLTLRGFVTRGWRVLDLEDARLSPLLHCADKSAMRRAFGSTGPAGTGDVALGSSKQPGLSAENDVTAGQCEGLSAIYCPRIHLPTATAPSSCHIHLQGDDDDGSAQDGVVGRAVFFKYNRAMIVVLLVDWSSEHPPKALSTQRVNAAVPSGIAATADLYSSLAVEARRHSACGLDFCASGADQVLREIRQGDRKAASLRSAEFLQRVRGTNLDSAEAAAADLGLLGKEIQSELSLNSEGSDRTGSSAVLDTGAESGEELKDADPAFHHRVLNHACLLALCCQMQVVLAPECALLEKALRGAVYADETGSMLRALGTATGSSGAAGGAAGGDFSAGAASVKPGPQSPGGAGQGGGSSQAGTTTATAGLSGSANAAVERLASAMAIAEELQLGAVRQDLPVPHTLRNARFIYHNPVDCTLRVCGINSSDLSPLMSAPRRFREALAANLLSATPQQLPAGHRGSSMMSALSSSSTSEKTDSASSRLRKVTAALAERLSDKQAFKFPATSTLLAECLEPAVVRALNDIWVELSGRNILETPTQPSAMAVQEACLRVATPQRGGVWVVGRQVRGRYLYMVIDRCVTMNDMYFAFEHLSDFLHK